MGAGTYSIANDYADKAKNYIFSIRIPINKLEIDSTDKGIDDYHKSKLLIHYCLYRLAENSRRQSSDIINVMIYVSDDYIVPSADIVNVSELIIDGNYVYVNKKGIRV